MSTDTPRVSARTDDEREHQLVEIETPSGEVSMVAFVGDAHAGEVEEAPADLTRELRGGVR